MIRRLALSAALLMVWPLALQPAWAQPGDTTGMLVVTQVDELTGAPGLNAVCLSGPREICANGNDRGVVSFVGLPVGDYQVETFAPFEEGLAQVSIRAGEITDVRLGVGDRSPRVRALVSSVARRAADGSLITPQVTVRTLLRNSTTAAVDGVLLHVTGPGGAQVQDCYVSGQGDDPCRRAQANAEAQWLVGAMPPGSQRGPFIAEFNAGAGGTAGLAGFAWFSWQTAVRSDSYAVTLGMSASSTLEPQGNGSLTLLPMINGQPVPALNLIVNTQETSAAGVTGPDGRVVFSGLPAGQYFIQGYGAQGRGFAQVAVADPGSVTARFAILPEWATSFPLADGARLAPAGGPPLQIDAITSVSGAPGTAASLNSVTRVRLENGGRYGASGEPVYDQSVTNVSVRITGPAATRFLNCQPACTQVQVPDASAVQFTVGSIDPFGGSGMLTATFVGGTASAGNLGPNTVTVTWTLDGRTQSYTVNLGQGVGR